MTPRGACRQHKRQASAECNPGSWAGMGDSDLTPVLALASLTDKCAALFVAYAAARFAALAARALARFATRAAFRAGDIFFLAGAFAAAFCALWTASHRFFVAATIAALPAALSFRFAFGAVCVAGADGSDSPRTFA